MALRANLFGGLRGRSLHSERTCQGGDEDKQLAAEVEAPDEDGPTGYHRSVVSVAFGFGF